MDRRLIALSKLAKSLLLQVILESNSEKLILAEDCNRLMMMSTMSWVQKEVSRGGGSVEERI